MNLRDVPDERDIPAARAAADKAMLSAIAAQPAHPARKAAIVGGTVVIAGALAAGGVLASGSGEPSNRGLVQCHTTLVAGEGDEFDGTTVARAQGARTGDPGSGPVSIDDAIAACADLYRQGVLTVGSTNAQGPDPASAGRVPPLVGCVTRDGVAAVFPSDSGALCSSLGMRSLVR